MPHESTSSSTFDMEILEYDEAPIFVVETSTGALPFDILYSNRAFRNGGMGNTFRAEDQGAIRFRAWAQALGQPVDSRHDFADYTWSVRAASKSGALKVIAGTLATPLERILENLNGDHRDPEATSNERDMNRGLPFSQPRIKHIGSKDGDLPALLRNVPRTNFNARWEGIQTMLEMSDVGVFEYNMDGALMYANDAWYKLSSYPKNTTTHEQFSFMDLVHPDDRAMVMGMWNTLAKGSPVAFEMRWKLRNGTNTDGSGNWVLASCVPIFDDEKVVCSVAGNIIDIDAQRKSQKAAQAQLEALEQARLSEMKFARFAELSPTAIYIFVPGTGMQFVNDQFYELMGLSHPAEDQFEWSNLIADEDLKDVEDDWAGMLQGQRSDGLQFRLKNTWINRDSMRESIWVQSSSYPQVDKHGNVLSIMGILFDISQFKWAESVQRRRVEEALEAKRQQENFIDMTSHELRNPLSAVVQCAESSIATLERLSLLASPTTPTETSPLSFQEEFEGIIDSLQTILTCSAHQKRVVDDVLALSKLDAGLIQITPVRVQICVVVLEAMKMFDVECRQLGIKLEFEEEASCKDFDWVMLDPSRLLQVLINLLTNAIKFTKDCPTKKITVELGGSYMRPPEVWESMPLKTDDQLRTTILDEPGWGNGPKAYLWIKVRDTGCGMSEDEQKRLFSRFSQATPRTHVRYGGSGLGLFISKTLATLQGGAIGASSKKDVGSTFAFFVSTRTTDAPTNQLTGLTSRVRPVLGNRIMTSEDAMRAVKLNVLIVEDNLVNQKVLRKQLQKFGWTVHVAGDGAEALVWLKGSYYWRGEQKNESCVQHGGEVDVILLDMEMPIMDGLTCVRRIREWEEQGLLANPPSISRRKSRGSIPTQSLSPIASNYDSNESEFRIPVLAVSANARMEQIQEALRAGMDDSITKPFRIPELWPKIQGLVPRLSGD